MLTRIIKNLATIILFLLQSVERLMRDFSANRNMYRGAHIFFTEGRLISLHFYNKMTEKYYFFNIVIHFL